MFGEQDDPKDDGSPYLFTVIRLCSKYSVSDSIIKRLNFYDLQALLIEYQIKDLESAIYQKEQQERNKRGLGPVKKASPADATAFFGGGGRKHG